MCLIFSSSLKATKELAISGSTLRPVYTDDFCGDFCGDFSHSDACTIEWLSHKSIDLYSFAQMV